MWKLGLQTKSGGRERFEIDSVSTFMVLKCKIFELTNIPPEKQILKTGRPPAIIQVNNEDTPIQNIGKMLQNMDLIIVDESQDSCSVPPPKRVKISDEIKHTPQFEDIDNPSNTVFSSKIEPQNVSTLIGVVERKVIPSDNSCLFASILHCLKPALYKLNKRLTPMDLRKICSDRVANEVKQNASSNLMSSITAESDGKLTSPAEYSKRILDSNSWGGYVECKILSEYFQVQIVAGNIEIGTFNKYPEDNSKFDARIYILYDGIHYDACQRGNGISVFRCEDGSDVYNEVAMVLFDLKEKRQFTNTTTFALFCQECYTNLEGQKEAQAHAKTTGHVNFVQK